MMSVMRGPLVGLISSGCCLALLFVMYPWSIYYGNFTYSAGITLASYLVLALLVGLVITAVGLSFLRSNMPQLGKGVLSGIVSLVTLLGGSMLFGPVGINLFGTRVRGIFFSEWKFVTFDVCIALPLSIPSASMVWWIGRRRQGGKGMASP